LGLNSIYFHAKTTLFGDYFLAYFGLWSIIYSNRMCFIFSWTMNVMSFSPFLKFVHILWISRIIWKLIHLKLQYVMSNCHEWWVTWLIDGVLSLSTGKHSTYFHRICVFIHILRYAMRNIIPSNNGLDVERLSFSWLLDSTLFMLNLSTFLEATVYGK
jgi:hypothetical protein